MAFLCPCFFENSIATTSSQNASFQVGEYVLTVVSVTGTQEVASGGRVQINGSTISGRESANIVYATPTTVQAYVNTRYEFLGWYTAILGGN